MNLSILVLIAGFGGIAFHELLYRRFTPAGEADFELGGLITHAGIDMGLLFGLLLSIVLIHDLNNHRSK